MIYKYPRYYDVNDTLVEVYLDKDSKGEDNIFARTKNGTDYDFGKVMLDGHEITKEEYEKGIVN